MAFASTFRKILPENYNQIPRITLASTWDENTSTKLYLLAENLAWNTLYLIFTYTNPEKADDGYFI